MNRPMTKLSLIVPAIAMAVLLTSSTQVEAAEIAASDFEMTCTGNHVKTDVVVDEVRTVSVTVLTGECTGTANGESFEIVAVNTETFIIGPN